MNRLPSILALLLTALALAAAGCGDDDDEATTDSGVSGATGASGAALPLDEWASSADEICADATKELDQQIETLTQGGEPSPAELEDYTTQTLVPSIQAQIDAISELGPPEGQEDEAQEFLDSAQSDLDALAEDPSLLEGDPFEDTEALAQDLGLRECATG